MSERNNFAGGFILGSIVGGVIGGVLGTVLASRSEHRATRRDKSLLQSDTPNKLDAEESIEIARRSLEDKIAQLNTAIDDVRQQLGAVNSNFNDDE
jgi:gas vesicle protein